MYSSNSLNSHLNYQHLSDESEVNMVSANINSSRIIHEANSNEATNHLELANDYSNGGGLQINYLPTEMLHHHGQLLQGIKKMDGSYLQAKDHLHVYESSDTGTTIIATSSQASQLPLLTPLKYVEYHNSIVGNEEQMIINEDSDKSDCDDGEHGLHKSSSKLPHKKRIAKKLNSNQPYNHQEQYSFVMPQEETNMRSMQAATPVFECNICGAGILDQLEFFIHLKQHYEPPAPMHLHMKSKHEIRSSRCEQDEDVIVDCGIIVDHRHHHHHVDAVETLPEKLIEELDESKENIKSEEIHRESLPEIDEFNEFSEPEDMMEDLRKEVEKVVETIDDNECLPESTWTYQVADEIEETDEQADDLQMYSENLIPDHVDSSVESTYEEIDHADESAVIQQQTEVKPYDSEDDEDNQPLVQVKMSLQRETKFDVETPKVQQEDDKEDIELTECLKKILNFKCSACNKGFNSRTALGYHLKTHTTERRYVCDQCGKKFLTNGALKVHQRLHTDDRPYECKFEDCGKSFRQWGDLKYHETSIHSNKKDHVCEFCAKAFARKYSLVIHRRIHTGERNYKCTDCDKSFRASSYLLNHKRIHTGEKPYSCSVQSCQKKFRVVGDLKRHMKIHERSKVSGLKEKKKEVISVIKKEPKEVVPAIRKEPIKKETIEKEASSPNDECVDLSFKDQDKSSLVYSNNEFVIYAKGSRSTNEKEDASPKKGRKATKRGKAK